MDWLDKLALGGIIVLGVVLIGWLVFVGYNAYVVDGYLYDNLSVVLGG